MELEDVMEIFEGLSNKKKVEILRNALGLMQSYNGQSEEAVIAKSMGYNNKNGKWFKDDK